MLVEKSSFLLGKRTAKEGLFKFTHLGVNKFEMTYKYTLHVDFKTNR